MSEREFELYLSLMSRLLRLGPEQTEAIADELRDHFDQRFEALCRQGVPREQAIRQALDEFGDAAGLATEFTQLARTRRRRLIMRCTLATVVLGAAALLVVEALAPPNPVVNGPPVAQAQGEEETEVAALDVPEPEPPTTIDPANFVPDPLSRKLNWEIVDMPLTGMLDELSERIGMPIFLHESSLSDSGVPTDIPITDRLDDLPAYLLLDRLETRDMDWYVDDGIIVVTSEEMADEHRSLRSHVIADLREQGYERDSLINVIQSATEGPWQDIDGIGGTLTPVGDVLFVRHSYRVHREVEGLLTALRRHDRETYTHSPPVHETIHQKLKVPTSVNFIDFPLSRAMGQLSHEPGLHIYIDAESLAEYGIPTDEPMNFILDNKPLDTILKYMLEPLGLAAVPDWGRLLITTDMIAEEMLQTVVHDVSDVCQTKEETEVLSRAVLNETSGPWQDIDGIGGMINVPTAGTIVVRQTERQLQEVRELLAAYRQAVAISKPLTEYPAELEKIETRYYRMNADTADDMARVLPRFVSPGTWRTGGFGGEATPEMVGEIRTIAVDPRIEKLPGRAVSAAAEPQAPAENQEEDKQSQPDVLVIPQAVLIIKQTKGIHREIERFLNHVDIGQRTPPIGSGSV